MNKKRKLLKNLLIELSKDDALSKKDAKSTYCNRLKQIYISENGEIFRHFYSDIFPVLTKLKQEDKNFIQVGQNLGILYKHSVNLNNPELSMALRKLWDHTNLEIARIEYVTSIDARLNITGQSLEEQYNEIKKQADEIKNKQDEINGTVKRINGIYSEFVSILGIFSAIVLVYFGGTSILGNVIKKINETFILKSVLICLIVGMIIFNIIFMFLYFLSKLLDRPISAINYGVEYFDIFERFKLRYPIVYYVDIFCLFAVVIDIIIWVGVIIVNNPNIFNDIYLSIYKNSHNIEILIILFIIIFNGCFFAYYIFCRVTNKLLGRYIVLRYTQKYEIDYGMNEYRLIDEIGRVYKSYNKYYKVLFSLFFRNYILKVTNTIINFFKRVFFRHRFFIAVNIILFFSLYFIKY